MVIFVLDILDNVLFNFKEIVFLVYMVYLVLRLFVINICIRLLVFFIFKVIG